MSYLSNKLKKTYISGKGYGFIANSNINSGEILIEDVPFTITSNKIYSDIFQLLYEVFKNKLMLLQFMKLCPKLLENHAENKEKILQELLKVKNHNIEIYDFFVNNYTTNEIMLFCTKYMRNAFSFKDKPSFLFIGTILNHSCLPNTIFGEVDGKMVFKAITNIKKGEEIYDNYIDITLHKNERQKYLLEQYGFSCNCDRCVETKRLNIEKYNDEAINIEYKRFKTFGFTKSQKITNNNL